MVKFVDIDPTIGPKDEITRMATCSSSTRLRVVTFLRNSSHLYRRVSRDCLSNGVLGGFPMTGLKVTLTDGSFHPVDSDQLSFETCCIIRHSKVLP